MSLAKLSTGKPKTYYVCCYCEPNDNLDDKALALVRKPCPTHGECWHRVVLIGPDGKTRLAFSVQPELEK